MRRRLRLTLAMPPIVADLRRHLADASHPKTYAVTPAQFDAVEDYLRDTQVARLAAWRAAGEPNGDIHGLFLLFPGSLGGLMFHGVELVTA